MPWGRILVYYLLVITGIMLYSSLDGPLDILLGHVLAAGGLDKCPQTGIVVGVRTSGLGGYCYFLSDAGEDAGHVAPAFELAFLSEFKCSSHTYFLTSMRVMYLSISYPSYVWGYLSLMTR